MYKNNKKMSPRTIFAATTTKEALRAWQEKTSQDPEEATRVSLEYQNPPIMRIGASIRKLVKCKVLSLACNMIERPLIPQNLLNLRVLNLSRNNLVTLAGIEVLGRTLEELWVSYNLIAKLTPIQYMKALKVFYVSHNNIKDWAEIRNLAEVPALLEISFVGNPLQQTMSEERFRRELAKRLPKLAKIDFIPILREEK